MKLFYKALRVHRRNNGVRERRRHINQLNRRAFMRNDLAVFEENEIRRLYDEETETWFFSVIDIVQILTNQSDYQTARKYWNKLKERLKKEGSQTVTNCHQLKMTAEDGKSRLTDVANAETVPLNLLKANNI